LRRPGGVPARIATVVGLTTRTPAVALINPCPSPNRPPMKNFLRLSLVVLGLVTLSSFASAATDTTPTTPPPAKGQHHAAKAKKKAKKKHKKHKKKPSGT